jgi:hypothetical protein
MIRPFEELSRRPGSSSLKITEEGKALASESPNEKAGPSDQAAYGKQHSTRNMMVAAISGAGYTFQRSRGDFAFAYPRDDAETTFGG